MRSTDGDHDITMKAMPAPAIPQSADDSKGVRPIYHGDLLEIYKIFLVNLIFNILTFGIYSFWAKTRIRRYLWQSIDIDGDRLEYTGTGQELFLGFLKFIFLFVVPVVLLLMAVEVLITDPDLLPVGAAAQLLLALPMAPLSIMALFWALRYRLSRTEWRSIRAGLGGSALGYAMRVILWGLANMVTLFLLTPIADVSIARYVIRHIHAGGTRMAVSRRGVGALYPSFLLAWIVPVVGMALLIIPSVAMFGALVSDGQESTALDLGAWLEGTDILIIVLMVLGVIAIFLLTALVSAWYRAAYYRYMAAEIRIGTIRLKSTVDGFSLMVLTLVNQVVMLISLGLGQPIVWHMTAKFICDKLRFGPRDALNAFKQNEMERPKTGEGFAEGLDVGGFI